MFSSSFFWNAQNDSKCNFIANPIPKVYKTLPPPIEEMDDVLAFIYTGPCQPTKAGFE